MRSGPVWASRGRDDQDPARRVVGGAVGVRPWSGAPCAGAWTPGSAAGGPAPARRCRGGLVILAGSRCCGSGSWDDHGRPARRRPPPGARDGRPPARDRDRAVPDPEGWDARVEANPLGSYLQLRRGRRSRRQRLDVDAGCSTRTRVSARRSCCAGRARCRGRSPTRRAARAGALGPRPPSRRSRNWHGPGSRAPHRAPATSGSTRRSRLGADRDEGGAVTGALLERPAGSPPPRSSPPRPAPSTSPATRRPCGATCARSGAST